MPLTREYFVKELGNMLWWGHTEDLEKASTTPLTSFEGMGFAYNPLPCPCVVCPTVHGPRGHVLFVLTPCPACKCAVSVTHPFSDGGESSRWFWQVLPSCRRVFDSCCWVNNWLENTRVLQNSDVNMTQLMCVRLLSNVGDEKRALCRFLMTGYRHQLVHAWSPYCFKRDYRFSVRWMAIDNKTIISLFEGPCILKRSFGSARMRLVLATTFIPAGTR